MLYNIVTLFPEWFESPLAAGQMGKAAQSGLVVFNLLTPRDKAADPHRTVDDRPYGGGPGMVLMADPMRQVLASISKPGRMIALSPSGRPLTQALARELAQEEALTLICGRYEGFDARLFDLFPLEAVSMGDFVLNGGEVGAMSLIEATARLLPGFMGKHESGDEESFSDHLLEYPHYTRPEHFEGLDVPPVLLSGDHARIAAWRRDESLLATLRTRPDLLARAALSGRDRAFLADRPRFRPGKNLHVALLHHPVLLKQEKTGTSSLTNLDVHDIARSSRSYGLGSFFVVTPLKDQQNLLQTLLEHWTSGPGSVSNPDRAKALALVKPAPDLDDAIRRIREACGFDPLLVGTSARPVVDKKGREKKLPTPFEDVGRQLETRPVLIILGTSHGLAREVLERCDAILPPLRWADRYNHLPVRAAAAIIMDRLLGDLG